MLCHNGIAYARKVGDKTLTLVVSGLLWNDSLVMLDLETNSLWSHLLGKAMQGPLAGQQLELLPSTMADWRTWKQRHPLTTVAVFRRVGNQYRNPLHRFPTPQLRDRLVIGLARGDIAKDWSFDLLRSVFVVNDEFDNAPVVACFHALSGTAAVFSRVLDGRILNFELRDEQLFDVETQTDWDMVTGRALSPSLLGKQLDQLPAIVSFAGAWKDFHVRSVSAEQN